MMKKRRCLESDKENDKRPGPDTKAHDSQRQKSDREDHLAKMKSGRRAHVQVEIGVMHQGR
jgi:hypothetical protein